MTGKKACVQAKAMGAHIALCPEMWSSGYCIPQEEKAVNELSVSAQDCFVQFFHTPAADLEIAIGITFLIVWFRGESEVRDMCTLEAPVDEGIFIAEIDMALLRDYREHEVMGQKYSQPEKYGAISALVISDKEVEF